MDLPDCPPGAEGYEDSVVEVPKKPEMDDNTCTKAEQEFQEHLNSLKIKLEDGETRCMVERRGRDISGKWIYLCYPCAAVCSGESILQTHISGKKHKTKLSMRTTWSHSIFDDHPFNQNQAGHTKSGATQKVLQKMAEAVDMYNKNTSELDMKYNKYRNAECHLQDALDGIKAPLLGLEYLVEHPPEEPHYEPSYMCTLCTKQGHPRTIVNHLTCFWHRYSYLLRHYSKACSLLTPYRTQPKYREGVGVIMNRLAQRIEDKYGRMKPVNIDKEEFEKDKERIISWIFKGYHFSENSGSTLEEVVDVGLITSLNKSLEESQAKSKSLNSGLSKKEPSPPVVAAPSKPHFNNFTRSANRRERRGASIESLSDISDDQEHQRRRDTTKDFRNTHRDRYEPHNKPRFEPYPDKRREGSPAFRSRYAIKNAPDKGKSGDKQRAPNYDYKVKLAAEKRLAAEESAKKTLAYHEKNPEKHPLYPDEWKKFWNKRYKEIQTEGKDPSKHDFKPEWILFWTKRMKELHDEELHIQVNELYRKMCLSPPDMTRREEPRQKSLEKWKSPERRRSPEPRIRSPESRRMDHRRERRTPDFRRSPGRRRSSERRRSPPRMKRTRSRSPAIHRKRSPRRSRSPLSRREAARPLRNRSPQHRAPAPALAPSMQTVLISDEEFKPDDALSPWNSDNDLDSLGSLPEAQSHAGSVHSIVSRSRSLRDARDSRDSRDRRVELQDMGSADNVVATLRLLVALEDYLGSLGPKIVDLLTEALKMEKEKANSSEDLLERDSAVVLIETAKEKLKGAAQAGLVAGPAAAAVRSAVVRAAATLHEADTRMRRKQAQAQQSISKAVAAPVPVAGVGEVDRAQIAQQMAAALIAQGKTDVSSEELEQLVDAVVGMAEAKKRETEVSKRVEARAAADNQARPSQHKMSGTATALQMLQSAYDENDKRMEKEDAPDAMDGLSDSDLETLLKNFNELSAEEQHSLIAYLKKLEAREPERVERLRQYVSAAANAGPQNIIEEPPPQKKEETKLVTIESDDDDYAVEEVFKSATQRVKEDQMRQEMEIVKKSLEETKEPPPAKLETTPELSPVLDLTKNLSSATDLLALVQASIQSTATAKPTVAAQSLDVVASNTIPRSFGDLPEVPMMPVEQIQQPVTQMQSVPQMPLTNNMQGGLLRPPHNLMNFGENRNFLHEPYNQKPNESYIQSSENHSYNQQSNESFNQQSNEPYIQQSNEPYPQQPNEPYPQQPNEPYTQQSNEPYDQQSNKPYSQQFNQPSNDNYNQSSWNQRPANSMGDNRGPPMRDSGFNNFGQGGGVGQFNSAGQTNQFNQGTRGSFMNARKQDNFNSRASDMNQPYGNNNFRGRGGSRGNFRGRGRGGYY